MKDSRRQMVKDTINCLGQVTVQDFSRPIVQWNYFSAGCPRFKIIFTDTAACINERTYVNQSCGIMMQIYPGGKNELLNDMIIRLQ